MSNNILTIPMVGMHFRGQPAKAIQPFIASGTEVLLVAEPENPYDPKAIKVLMWGKELRPEVRDQIEGALEGTGFCYLDLEELEEPIQLGYLQDSDGKPASKNGRPGNREAHGLLGGQGLWSEAKGTLSFDETGQPQVLISVEPSAEDEVHD